MKWLLIEMVRALPAGVLASRLGWPLFVWALVNDESEGGREIRAALGCRE